MTDAPTSTEELWELLSTRLRSFLARSVGDDQVAEDLLQETFLRIHTGLGDIDDSQRMTAWVFQIARNLVVDHRRSRSGHTPGGRGVEPEVSAKDEDENLNEVVRDWIPAMIARLPTPYREAVELYELRGMPQQQIAEQLGISLSGAKSRVQRGREKLASLPFECCTFERDRRGNVIDYSRRNPELCEECEPD